MERELDWITGIQRAIDYVEEHITEEIDYEEVAKRAYSSGFHFQRVFAIICGFTLGEYIRSRRLSLAGFELAKTDSKVIDVALKYGYDAPESFTRAFTRFHGVSPSAVKNGAALKSFSRLCVKLSLQGGTVMDYRIVKKDAFDVIIRKKEFPKNHEITNAEIPNFWSECHQDGTIKKLIGYIPNGDEFGLLGLALYNREAKDFHYGIGASYDGRELSDDAFQIERIPAHTYVVFKIVGQMPQAFQDVYRYITTEFFPTSNYLPAGVELEAYPSDDVHNPNYTCELWIAVEQK